MALAHMRRRTQAMYEVEKGRALPGAPSGRSKYPFKEMGVGDSFAVPREEVAAVRNAAAQYGYRTGYIMSVRKDGDGFRCWRLSTSEVMRRSIL